MRKSEMAALAIVLLSFVIGIYIYPQMPETMVFHWNARGEADGYASKLFGLFLMPAVSFVLFLLFVAIPKIDPLKQNIAKFRKYFDRFVLLIMIFLFYLYLITILWNFGFSFNIIQLLVPAFAALFYYCGILIEKAKRNWFIGIRTPWTMSSDKVWDKTHRLGGKLFKISGIISLLGLLSEDYAIYAVILPIISFTVFLFVYSYFQYRKNGK